MIVIQVLCVLGLGEITKQDIISKIGENAHFRTLGEVALVVERADLIIDVRLDDVEELVLKACTFAADIFENRNVTVAKVVRTKFKFLCQEDRATWDALAERVNGLRPAERRQRRFVVTALLSALAGGVVSEIWGKHEDRSKLKALAAEQDRLMHIADELDARSAVDERHLRELGDLVEHQAHMEALRTELVSAAIAALGSFALVRREIAHFSNVLSAALQHGRPSPRLFAPGALSDQLGQLRRQVEEQGLRLDLAAEQEIWECPMSYGTFSSRVLRMVIHVPVTKNVEPFRLLQFVPVPWKIQNSNAFGVAECPEGRETIAVDTHGNQYYDVQITGLVGSSTRPGYWRTSSPIIVRRDSQTSCLWSIFRGRSRAILKACNLHTPPEEISFFPTGAYEFLVFTAKEQRLDIWCDGRRVESVRFAGVRQLDLKAGCIVQGAEIFMQVPRNVPVAVQHVKAAPVRFDLNDLGEWIKHQRAGRQSERTFLAWVKEPGRKLLHTAAEHAVIMAQASDESSADWGVSILEWVWDHPVTTGAAGLLLLFITFFMARKRATVIEFCCRKSQKSRRQSGESGSSVNDISSGPGRTPTPSSTSSPTPNQSSRSSSSQESAAQDGLHALLESLSGDEREELLRTLTRKRKRSTPGPEDSTRSKGSQGLNVNIQGH